MLTKRTSKNQVTLPKALLEQLPEADYFDATVEEGAVVLRPVRITPLVDIDRVRDRLAESGLTARDAKAAVRWARRRQ
jgi:hypothetical protein